ncbi:MAG TPA: hypothetical protein VGJ62_14925 [Gemmatimonadaceae bacterium]
MPILGDIDIAVHEFGHMLFMPFGIQFLGSTMMILGGSLTQVAFPLLFFGYFLRKRDDGRRHVRGHGVPLVVRDEPSQRRRLLRRLAAWSAPQLPRDSAPNQTAVDQRS